MIARLSSRDFGVIEAQRARDARGHARRRAPAVHCFALAMLLMVGCASTSESVHLPPLNPEGIKDREQAEGALASVAKVRKEKDLDWRRRERGCYDRFFATDCLNRLAAERREAEYRFKTIEIRARFILRESRIQQEALDEARRLDTQGPR
jgi:hypothetical protein